MLPRDCSDKIRTNDQAEFEGTRFWCLADLITAIVSVGPPSSTHHPFGDSIMARCLFTVEDTFVIRNRGLVLVPGIIPEGDERFRLGDPIILLRPDGSSFRTEIGGVEMIDPNPRHDLVIMLKGMAKGDVPVGTEVWSVEA